MLVNVSVRPHVQRECKRDLTIRKTLEKKREYKKHQWHQNHKERRKNRGTAKEENTAERMQKTLEIAHKSVCEVCLTSRCA